MFEACEIELYDLPARRPIKELYRESREGFDMRDYDTVFLQDEETGETYVVRMATGIQSKFFQISRRVK